MNGAYNIMVVEDDVSAGKVIEFELKAKGYICKRFENAEDGLVYFGQHAVDLVLVDYSLPGMNGEEFYKKALGLNPMTPVIFMTALKSVEKAVELMKLGAYSYLTKPLDIDQLHRTINQALEKVKLEKEAQLLKETLDDGCTECSNDTLDYVFGSGRMAGILRLVRRVAVSHSNVLITGESGTGKDVIANIIHDCSSRKDQRMVKVNLSALPPTLVEAELFGAVKGAYTGADKDRPGKFEEADKGTLFLDEIGELSPDIQVKLLRVIQDREVTRLGSNTPYKLDIRLITATNKNLRKLVDDGKFREDLFYRLNVIDIEMPPLRERKEDIPNLTRVFIDRFSHRENKPVNDIAREALDVLVKYSFPGNIRELENIIERAVVLTERDTICSEDLPMFILNSEHFDPVSMTDDSPLSLTERLNVVEKDILEKTLKKYNYHQSNAALELGVSEGCLRYKMRTLGIARDKAIKLS